MSWEASLGAFFAIMPVVAFLFYLLGRRTATRAITTNSGVTGTGTPVPNNAPAAPAAGTTTPTAPNTSPSRVTKITDWLRARVVVVIIALVAIVAIMYYSLPGTIGLGIDFATALFIGVVLILAGFFIPKKPEWLPKALVGTGLLTILTFGFFGSEFGRAFKTGVADLQKCVATNDCPSYTATPGTPTYGFMHPIVLRPGEMSQPIANYSGSYLNWTLKSGAKMPEFQHRDSHTGEWKPGMSTKAWWYRLVLPSTATEPVTVLVRRVQGVPPRS